MPRSLGRSLLAGAAASLAACALAAPAHAAAPAVAPAHAAVLAAAPAVAPAHAAVLAAAPAVAPAHAAALAAAPTVDVVAPPVTVAAGGSTVVYPLVFAKQHLQLTNMTLTLELSGLVGVSLQKWIYSGLTCTEQSATKLVCTYPEIGIDTHSNPSFATQVSATKAALGQTGQFKVTFAADGITPATDTSDVTVAEGIDLAAGDSHEISVKPGSAFQATLQVHNNTDARVHGVVLIFDTDYAFDPAKRFSNCLYGGGVPAQNTCTFVQDLMPGVTYQVALPYRLRPDTLAPGESGGAFQWLTPRDYAGALKLNDDLGLDPPSGKPGSGGPLELVPLPPAHSLAEQTDTDWNNNAQQLTVKATGRQDADLVALGATASGEAGATVTVQIGVRNDGPATIDWSRHGEPAELALVSIPHGTTVTKAPPGCVPVRDVLSPPPSSALVQYACLSYAVFRAKTTLTWPFELRIDKVVANATGRVESNPKNRHDLYDRDTHTANDVAPIVVNPVAAGGQGGGSLPITGPRTGIVAVAGALLIAAGGLLLMRRRRTRFEA